MLRIRSSLALLLPCLALIGVGCATYEQELGRAEEHFTHDEHEKSLATLRALESDWTSFGVKDRARYAYLRGMTDYRIGFKADARHWLAVSAQIEREHPGSLAATEKALVDEKLGELNQVVWSGDVLPMEEAPGTKPVKKVTTTTGEGDDEATPKKKKAADDEEAPAPKKKAADDDDSPKPKKKKSKDD
jgi:hypothetical protein